MPDELSETHQVVERSLADVHWSELTANREYFRSPAAWEDEVLYFLMVDRFSDGKEVGGFRDREGNAVTGPDTQRTTPLFAVEADAYKADRDAWTKAGRTWCGGTLAGIKDKLGYLQRLGVTAIWLSPIFKQVAGSDDYHGYGVQNFLAVEPRFGTREELRDLVQAAHNLGIRIILDIILNHAGNVFAYQGNERYFYSDGTKWPVDGYRTSSGDAGSLPFGELDPGTQPGSWPDGGVWPRELQAPETWTRQGEIRGWDLFPEYLDGDFFALKDIDHGPGPTDPALAWDFLERIRQFRPSMALVHLSQVFKFWIAYADVDGFRIDTVKHMEPGAVRFLTNVIHEFAQTLGKEDFYLIGEVTGGRANAINTVDTTGINAALGINDIPDKLEFLAKGWRSPGNPGAGTQDGYFDLFRNSLQDNKNTHQWYIKHVVTLFDDHDQVGAQRKFRFCGQGDGHRFLKAALGLNLASLGIPCLYYGTEQGFDGADLRGDGESNEFSDAFLRECMFGGPFGSLQSTGRHFFNEEHEVYRFVRELCALRHDHIALRRGRQYLRQVSATGQDGDFHYPQPVGGEMRWVVAWSRFFADQEYLCAINTDPNRPISVWATVDASLQRPGVTQMSCLISTDPSRQGQAMTVEARNGSAIRIEVPAAGFVVFA